MKKLFLIISLLFGINGILYADQNMSSQQRGILQAPQSMPSENKNSTGGQINTSPLGTLGGTSDPSSQSSTTRTNDRHIIYPSHPAP